MKGQRIAKLRGTRSRKCGKKWEKPPQGGKLEGPNTHGKVVPLTMQAGGGGKLEPH